MKVAISKLTMETINPDLDFGQESRGHSWTAYQVEGKPLPLRKINMRLRGYCWFEVSKEEFEQMRVGDIYEVQLQLVSRENKKKSRPNNQGRQ